MQKTLKAPDRSALSRYGRPWPLPCAWPSRRLYEMVFDPPALSEAEIQARREAEQHRQHLEARYGGEVPEKEVEAFEKLYAAAWPYADQLETALTAVRASASDRQRQQGNRKKM